MSKIKLIRCKTPHDVLVVKDRKDLEQFMRIGGNWPEPNCGHPHLIVSGDIWFARPKK